MNNQVITNSQSTNHLEFSKIVKVSFPALLGINVAVTSILFIHYYRNTKKISTIKKTAFLERKRFLYVL